MVNYNVKLYTGSGYSTTINLPAVTSINLSITASISTQEGVNATYPITITHNGVNTPTLAIAGEVRADSSTTAVIKDRITGTTITPATMSDIWSIVSNINNKFKIEAFLLSDNNVITSSSTVNYFIGYVKSIQVSPMTTYISNDKYIGKYLSYTIVFSLTGE